MMHRFYLSGAQLDAKHHAQALADAVAGLGVDKRQYGEAAGFVR